MHLESAHQEYEVTERFHPAVASTGTPSVRPALRGTSMRRSRSASNPARAMDRYESHLPSGEKRGVLSAPAFAAVRSRIPLPSGPIRLMSTFVLSATTESA